MAKRRRRKKTFAEKLYNTNVLPDGNLKSVNDIDVVLEKLANPSYEDEEKGQMGTL